MSVVVEIRFIVNGGVLLSWVHELPDFSSRSSASDKVKPGRPVFLLEELDGGRIG